MNKRAEKWWLNKGQFYDQDSKIYPKKLVMDAYIAGFNVGVTVGKNEIQPADATDDLFRCPCCGEPWDTKNYSACRCGAVINRR